MTSFSSRVFENAVVLLQNKNIAAKDALSQVLLSESATDKQRNECWKLFSKALITMKIGAGLNYNLECLKQACKLSGILPPTGGLKYKKVSKSKVQTQTDCKPKKQIVLNSALLPKQKSITKKYIKGEVCQTVANFGMQPIKCNNDIMPNAQFQFSRKVGKVGNIDLPANTTIVFVEKKQVFKGTASKKMLFKVLKNTLLLDGTRTTKEIIVAGVSNHVDINDDYNASLRKKIALELLEEEKNKSSVSTTEAIRDVA